MVRLTANEGMRPGLLDLLNGQPAVLRTVPLRMTQQENMFSEDWEF